VERGGLMHDPSLMTLGRPVRRLWAGAVRALVRGAARLLLLGVPLRSAAPGDK
jgi:hypothetical protein